MIRQHHLAKKLLMLFLESELTRLSVWCNPLNSLGHGNPACFTGSTEKSMVMDESWKEIVRFAWELSPRLAVQMNERFVQPIVHRELHRLIANNTLDVVDVPEALVILLGDRLLPNAKLDLKVCMTSSRILFLLTHTFMVALAILGTCTCHHCCELLFARIQQPSIDFAVCYA